MWLICKREGVVAFCADARIRQTRIDAGARAALGTTTRFAYPIPMRALGGETYGQSFERLESGTDRAELGGASKLANDPVD